MDAEAKNSEERELFQLIAGGDEKAFGQLFHRYGPILQPFINGIVKNDALARELVQEVFLRIWLKKDILPTINNPFSWIYRIASNLALTEFRSQQMEQTLLKAVGKQDLNTSSDPIADSLDGKELNSIIRDAVGQLPPQRQKIFTLSREEGLSRKEIARQLNISENTVRNQLVIALKNIQDHIRQATGFYIPFILIMSLAQSFC